MTGTRRTFAEVKLRLGEDAWQAALDLAAAAPPLTPQQETALSILLRRDRPVGNLDMGERGSSTAA